MARHIVLVSVFLGAFLLFQIQPIIGKVILPWFGGTPAVWTTCMLFFQVVLLCGYLYAHASVSCLKPRAQGPLHLLLLLAGLALLPAIPDASWRPAGPGSAAWQILALLAATAGLPLFLLSATSPLLQAWYSRQQPGASPYRLYALSNAASLLALVSYPFLVEPALSVQTQALAWSAVYGLFTLSCGWCALKTWRSAPETPAAAFGEWFGGSAEERRAPRPPTPADCAMWLGFSACDSALLLATTSQLAQNVATVPLLWILPLCLYLLSFVICFDNPKWYWRPLWLAALPVVVAGAFAAPYFNTRMPLALQVPVYCAVLFAGCMLCHGELARLKPASRHLTGYYLLVGTGGALGGVACSLIAPAVFTGLWEYQCSIEALCVLTLLALLRDEHATLRLKPVYAWTLVIAGGLSVGVAFVQQARNSQTHALAVSRNFYGVLRVEQRDSADGPLYSLVHGRITHGSQFLDEKLRRTPTAYYGADSGLGVAEAALRTRGGAHGERAALRIGAVGLGAGVAASYGTAGDTLRFYEINPEVARLAREYFSFLRDTAASVDVILGDARVSLEQERSRGEPQQFDLLVLDAFNGDAVPLHLLTREGFALYNYHLAPAGVLAVHISSHYLAMAPLVFGLADGAGMQAVLIEDVQRTTPRLDSSTWVLVTRDTALLELPVVAGRAAPPPDSSVWLSFTDDYSNLLQLLRRSTVPRAGQ